MPRDWAAVDYYAVLGVASDAPHDAITAAFHRLARETHPDAHPDDPDAEERFKQASVAYDVLRDPIARADYDRVRGIEPPGARSGRQWARREKARRPWTGPPGYDPDDGDLWQPSTAAAREAAGPTPRRGRRVWVRPRWFPEPWMLAFVGAILGGTALIVDWQDGRVPDGWLVTTAVVTEARVTGPGCPPDCPTPRSIEASLGDSGELDQPYRGPAEAGERLSIAFDPNGYRWKILDEQTYAPWAIGIPGATLLVAAGLLAVLSARPRRYPLRRG